MKNAGLLLLVLLGLGSGFATADEEPPAQTKARTPQQAADGVLAAVQADDQEVLKVLAESDDPDPWLVADELCHRRAHDAAEAFAKAAPRKAVEGLSAYVASRRGQEPESEARAALATMRAVMGEDPPAALAASVALVGPPATVVRIRIAMNRGVAFLNTDRPVESAAAFRSAGEAADDLGWRRFAMLAWHEAGSSAYLVPDWAAVQSAWKRSLVLAEELDAKGRAAGLLGNLGNIHFRLRELPEALACYERTAALWKELGDQGGVAHSLDSMGRTHQWLGESAKALSCYERALALWEKSGIRPRMADTLENIGLVQMNTGAHGAALSSLQRALDLMEALDERDGMGRTIVFIGIAHYHLGAYAKARDCQTRALALSEERGDRATMADALLNLGNVHSDLGESAKGLACYERALTLMEEIGDQLGVAAALGNIALLHETFGANEKALTYQKRALALMEAGGDLQGAANTLGSIGILHLRRGEDEEALQHLEEALSLQQRIGDRGGVANTLSKIARVHIHRGAYAEAVTCFERALTIMEQIGERRQIAVTLGNLGVARLGQGDTEGGEKALARAVREARRIRAREPLVRHLGNLGRSRLKRGEAGRALLAAREALIEMESMLGGLAEEESATARAELALVYDVGTLAAARLEEPAEAIAFLESGRAGALLESLGGRQSLRRADLPEELRQAEADAEATEARAREGYDRALAAGQIRDIRNSARALDEAVEQVREVAARIQRDAKKQAGLFYPRAATLEEIQGWLPPGQVLVLYGLCLEEALALVLTNDAERIVSLGSVAEVEAACRALHLDTAEGDASAALQVLREVLVEPLDLSDDVNTLLVSPVGSISYVPFGAIFDAPVACTPSGTTHALLMDERREPGEGVLALGDPSYGEVDQSAAAVYRGGGTLQPLPGTRAEAMAVGDVVLLGAEANEARLRESIAQREHWRAIHLACHGLIDPERPTLSSLALTRHPEEDGFLTALQVLRMQIPADLAVLSACETGKGRIVRGEGIVGLTRAFMYAGAPRVICSLWRVDDEATRALMVKFYELWNPRPEGADPERPKGVEGAEREGLGAAAALAKAQAYVRSHEKWKHPHYWAAWVLWGLPE